MNKRIAKRKYKQALEIMKNPRKYGTSVMIENHIYCDENGRPCDPLQQNVRYVMLKRPRIIYRRTAKTE